MWLDGKIAYHSTKFLVRGRRSRDLLAIAIHIVCNWLLVGNLICIDSTVICEIFVVKNLELIG